jgi:hypothetical protein
MENKVNRRKFVTRAAIGAAAVGALAVGAKPAAGNIVWGTAKVPKGKIAAAFYHSLAYGVLFRQAQALRPGLTIDRFRAELIAAVQADTAAAVAEARSQGRI